MPRQQEAAPTTRRPTPPTTPPGRSLAIGDIIPGRRDAVVDLAAFRASRRRAGLAEAGLLVGSLAHVDLGPGRGLQAAGMSDQLGPDWVGRQFLDADPNATGQGTLGQRQRAGGSRPPPSSRSTASTTTTAS